MHADSSSKEKLDFWQKPAKRSTPPEITSNKLSPTPIYSTMPDIQTTSPSAGRVRAISTKLRSSPRRRLRPQTTLLALPHHRRRRSDSLALAELLGPLHSEADPRRPRLRAVLSEELLAGRRSVHHLSGRSLEEVRLDPPLAHPRSVNPPLHRLSVRRPPHPHSDHPLSVQRQTNRHPLLGHHRRPGPRLAPHRRPLRAVRHLGSPLSVQAAAGRPLRLSGHLLEGHRPHLVEQPRPPSPLLARPAPLLQHSGSRVLLSPLSDRQPLRPRHSDNLPLVNPPHPQAEARSASQPSGKRPNPPRSAHHQLNHLLSVPQRHQARHRRHSAPLPRRAALARQLSVKPQPHLPPLANQHLASPLLLRSGSLLLPPTRSAQPPRVRLAQSRQRRPLHQHLASRLSVSPLRLLAVQVAALLVRARSATRLPGPTSPLLRMPRMPHVQRAPKRQRRRPTPRSDKPDRTPRRALAAHLHSVPSHLRRAHSARARRPSARPRPHLHKIRRRPVPLVVRHQRSAPTRPQLGRVRQVRPRWGHRRRTRGGATPIHGRSFFPGQLVTEARRRSVMR